MSPVGADADIARSCRHVSFWTLTVFERRSGLAVSLIQVRVESLPASRVHCFSNGRIDWSNDEYRPNTLQGCTFVTTSDRRKRRKTGRSQLLRQFGQGASSTASHASLSSSSRDSSESEGRNGLAVPVSEDLEGKRRAMECIGSRLFVADANEPQFAVAQRWIEACSRQVRLPLNFCGGLLIMRLYRLITPPSEQTPDCMIAVYEAAAAYDFAFLALGHADDEADMTLFRDGEATRFVTHPDTRAVDGINLLLSGVTAMHETLNRWPRPVAQENEALSTGRHPLALEIMEALMRALREASFPILLDRAGLGHTANDTLTSTSLAALLVDAESLQRVESFVRHRAHTYFMRATELATQLAGYTAIEADLAETLDKLFSLWGSMGAATDDLQDIFVDFAAGIHSVCTVMAHLCVAEDESLRPVFRRDLPEDLVREQRKRLTGFFGVTDAKLDHAALVGLLNEIGLRKALTEHFEAQGTLFAAAIYKATFHFGFNPKLMMEIVSVVCRDPEFDVPAIYLSALERVSDENVLRIMNVQVGKFITAYFVERFWPKDGAV
jgi:truncated hemoglobin YjbI